MAKIVLKIMRILKKRHGSKNGAAILKEQYVQWDISWF